MFGNSTYEEFCDSYTTWGDKELKNELGECIESISWHNAMACACMPTMIALIALVSSLVGILANEASRTGSSYDFFWMIENGGRIPLGMIAILLILGFWSGWRLMKQSLKKRVIDDILKARDEERRYAWWQAAVRGQVFRVDITMHND
jgi:Zn-dependent protease with chaperone function